MFNKVVRDDEKCTYNAFLFGLVICICSFIMTEVLHAVFIFRVPIYFIIGYIFARINNKKY